MADYQPYLVSSFQTGLFNYQQPWSRPLDAFEPLENAQVFRGNVRKRNGSVQLGNQLDDTKPVMGIMNYINESNGNESLVVGTTRNAYLFNDGSQTFAPITSVSASNFWQGVVPVSQTITVDTFWPNIAPSSVSITDGTSTITDDGAGNLTAAGIFAAGGTIDYPSGSVTLNFTLGSVGSLISLNISCTSTDYFSGTIRNFFNFTNWQPTDPKTFVISTSYLYMTNNVDPITLFDGSSLSRPIYYINTANSDYVKTTFDIVVFKNRLLFVKPIINSSPNNPLNQTIFWSQQFNPKQFRNDISGLGGSLTAATSDILQSFNFLRDLCVVRFSRSVWVFRFTGNDFNPFAFLKVNSTKRTNAPYASIEYDERETGIGSTGLTACDGVNVQRYDIPIIDFYESEMAQFYFQQAFSQRYDNNQESWMLFVSSSNTFPLVGSVAPGSDKALIYNFLENTWATYDFKIPMTCLGIYKVVAGLTWADITESWKSQDRPWFSYSGQKNAPNLLGGDTTGHVYWLDNESANNDAGQSITTTIKTNRWNPFISSGEKVQFGYIDVYYERNDDCELLVEFFLDNSGTPCGQQTLTLDANGNDGASNSGYAMKRIYINGMGEFLQMQMTSSSEAPFNFTAFVLWARPAGRLTP